MKWLAVLLCLGASVAQADVNIEFVEKVIPVYPAELRKAAITGSVTVSFNLLANGSVADVKVIQSSDPAFADAALDAVKQWRFKPWTVSKENPASIEVRNELRFRLNDKDEWRQIYERAGLVLMTCKQFNDEVALYRKDDPKRSLAEMDTTLLSIRMISHYNVDGATSYKESVATGDAFREALPKITEGCQTYPGVDFVDLWPASLRDRLVQKR